MGDAIDKIGQAQQGVSEIITVENTADMIEELAGMQAIQCTPTGSNLTEYGNALNDTMSASSGILLADLRTINRQVAVERNSVKLMSSAPGPSPPRRG